MEQQKTVETEREAYLAPSYKQFCFETSGLAQMSNNGNGGDVVDDGAEEVD